MPAGTSVSGSDPHGAAAHNQRRRAFVARPIHFGGNANFVAFDNLASGTDEPTNVPESDSLALLDPGVVLGFFVSGPAIAQRTKQEGQTVGAAPRHFGRRWSHLFRLRSSTYCA